MKHILFKSLLYNYQYDKLILRIKNLLKKWKFISRFASTDSIHQEWQLLQFITTSLGTSSLMQGFPCGSASKESACNVGDLGSIPGLRRSPGKGKVYPLQYSGLENSKNCIVHGSQRVGHNWATFTFTSFKSARLLIWVFPVNSINDQWPYPKFLPGLWTPVGCIPLFFHLCWILSN